MDTDFVKYFSTLGVGGAIAGFMFLIYRIDHARVVTLTAESAAREALLIQCLREDGISREKLSTAITTLISQIQVTRDQQASETRHLLERVLLERQSPA